MAKICKKWWLGSIAFDEIKQAKANQAGVWIASNYYVVSTLPKTSEKMDNMLLFQKILDILHKIWNPQWF